MIWNLNLTPRGWGESLTLPMATGGADTFLLNLDPANLPHDMLDEVVYMAQANPRHAYDLLTAFPRAVLEWMSSTPARWELVQRRGEFLRWGLKVATQADADERVPIAARWPVRYRWLQAPAGLNLTRWMPHEFSRIGHAATCEDCGLIRGENPFHRVDTIPTFRKVVHAAQV